MNTRLSSIVCLTIAVAAHAEGPATQPSGVSVNGPGITTLTLTATELAAMPRHALNVKDHEGKQTTYDGVLVRDVLLKAGITIGEKRMKGPLVGQAVLVTSTDGYKVAFGLAEFDPDYAEREILLADRRDGKPLTAKEGPFRLVVPQEARQGRWARMVAGITVTSLEQK